MKAILLVGATSMHSLPCRTTGQLRLHSCRHFFGLHLSLFTLLWVGFVGGWVGGLKRWVGGWKPHRHNRQRTWQYA